MPSKSHSRANITTQRTYNRQTYYKIVKAVQDANQRGEPIYYFKLCELMPELDIESMRTTTLNKFMRDAEAWGMLEAQSYGRRGYRFLTVTSVAEAFLAYCEKNSSKTFQDQTVTERYIAKSGDKALIKFNEIAILAKGKRITIRQAAAALLMTRKEFLQLMKENYHPKDPKEKAHEYYLKHSEEKKQQSRMYYAEHKEESHAYYLKHKEEKNQQSRT